MTIQNTELLRRISVTGLHPDDAREITRIFPFLTEEKQIQIFETWDAVVANIRLHRMEYEKEKEILLVQAIKDIENDLEEYNKQLVQSSAKKKLKSLQINI
jgi:hypothetical protein